MMGQGLSVLSFHALSAHALVSSGLHHHNSDQGTGSDLEWSLGATVVHCSLRMD